MKVTFFLIFFILVSCTPVPHSSLVFGIDFPLSGGLSVYGTPLLEGIKLGITDVNSQGGVNGIPLTLIIEDNEGKPPVAATAATKLIEQDNVTLLLSTLVGPSGAIAPIAESHNKLLLYAAASGDFAKKNKLVFKDSIDAEVDCDLFARSLNYTSVALFGAVGEFTQNCKAAFEKIGVTVEPYELYTKGQDVDFRTPLSKIKEAHPSAVVLSAYADDCLLIWKTISELDLNTAFLLPFTQTGCGDEQSQKVIPPNATVIGANFIVDEQSQKYQQFISAYQATYHKEPSLLFFTALGYDWVHYLAEALRDCPLKETACIASALEHTTYAGVWGTVSFSEHIGVRPREIID